MKRTDGQNRSITAAWRPATRAVRGGTRRSEYGETSEAIFVTSGYCYDDAETVAARFAGEAEGMTYSRLQNPTVEMLEERIALLEGAEACRAQASGMAAMTAAMLCQLRTGDHVVAARAAFGSCRWLTDTLLPRFGIATTTIDSRDNNAWEAAIRPETKLFFFETPANPTMDIVDLAHVCGLARSRGIVSVVDSRDNNAWEAAIRPETKLFFFETPANPTMDIVDLAHVCGLARSRGIVSVVDNAFATSALQRPMDYSADIVAYSATKMMDGQGRVLAGAICGSQAFIDEQLMPFQRNTGPSLSPFNAWVVLKGLETLDLRIRRQSESALAMGRFLEPRVPHMLHPGLPSHPRHALAMAQMSGLAGPIFAFALDGGREQAMALLNALQLIDISNNIGDSRSLMTHPASTTHHGVGAEARAEMGVTEGMLRINVGLEDPADLIEDLDRALRAVGL